MKVPKLFHVALQLLRSSALVAAVAYLIGTLSYRVCFLHPIEFNSDFAAFLSLDYLVDFFLVIEGVISFRSAKVAPDARTGSQLFAGKSMQLNNAVAIMPRNSDDTPPTIKESRYQMVVHYAALCWRTCSLFPFEVVGYLCGMPNFGYLRLFRLMHCVYLPSYWDSFMEVLERYEISKNSGFHRLALIVFIEFIITHLAACVFYAIAVNLLYEHNVNNWLVKDKNAELGPNGEVILLNGVFYRYIRAAYWSSATIAGIGYGDISAWAESETWFEIAFFYITVMIICLTISTFSMLVTNFDSATVAHRQKVVKFNKYASHRKLPADLTKRVLSYYEYQWQLLKGVDENNILSELPANLSQQVLHLVVRDVLVGVPVLKDLNKALLNALSELVESYVYSPLDIIVDWNSKVAGVYIVSTGEVQKLTMLQASKKEGHSLAATTGSNKAGSTKESSADDVSETAAVTGEEDAQAAQLSGDDANADSEHEDGVADQPRPAESTEPPAPNADFMQRPRKSSANRADPNNFLYAGESFGSQALYKSYTSTIKYKTKSFAEVLLLRGSVYRHMCKLYLRKDELAAMYKKISELARNDGAPAPGTAKPASHKRKGRNSIVVANRKKPVLFIEAALASSSREYVKFFLPDSPFRAHWECLIFCGMMFYIVVGALLLQGNVRANFLVNYYTLLVVCYIVDVVFFADLLLRALLFGYENQGLMVTKSSLIFANFRALNDPVVTFLSVFPFDLILALSVDFRLIPLLRLLKLLHLTRADAYMLRAEQTFSQYTGITLTFEMSRFVSLYCYLFLLCHWCACIWQLTADASVNIFGYHTNWRDFDSHSDFFSVNYAALSDTAFYARSFYWAIGMLSGIGFPDMLAKNPIEMVTISIMMIFGAMAFNTLLGAIATLMSSFGKDRREFQSKVDKVRQLMSYKNIPMEIEAKVLRYYEYIWARYGGVNESEVLSTLPKSLKAVVAAHVMGPFIQRIPFFKCSEPMEQLIVSLFQSRVFLHDDPLMLYGEMGREMFIIESGEVQVTSHDRKLTFATLTSGAYIGESCLLDLTKRTASVYAVHYVDTYFLTCDHFLKACEKFPSEYGTIIDGVRAVLDEKLRKNAALTKTAADGHIDREVTAQVSRMNEVALKSFQSILFSNALFRNITIFPDDAHKIHPDSPLKLAWDVLFFCVLVYYAIIIPLRIALDLNPAIFIADYLCDALSILDSYLYFTVFALYKGGQLVRKNADLQKNFRQERMIIDIVAELPYDLLVLCFRSSYSGDMFLLIRAALRVPKLVKLWLLPNYFKQVERLSALLHCNALLFKFLEINFSIIVFSHWVACIFYCFSIFGQRGGDCDKTELHEYYGYGCQFRGTWVTQQIASGKLPLDGGTQWDRYIRAYNWALPTLVVKTMGEVWVMNANEVILAVLVIFFGLSISGMIIGNVMSIVSSASEESTKMYRNIELLRGYLTANNVPVGLINTTVALLRHQGSTEGSLTLNQEAILQDLPHSIQLAFDTHVKTLPFLRKCPFFDFYTDEVLREISAKLRVNMYVRGDQVLSFGELGYEMFFLESGVVNVTSGDGKTLYSTLEDGAFFGETAVFFNTVRTATITVASPFCVCMTLRKADFEAVLRSSEFDEDAVVESFKMLQTANQRRNAAVTRNLALAKDPASKLHKLIVQGDKGLNPVPVLVRLRKHLHPDSTFRAVWDALGLLILIYYIFSIPLYACFLYGKKLEIYYYNFIAFDFILDGYWVMDIVLKAFVFSVKLNIFNDRVITDGEVIFSHYQKSGLLYLDILASIPLEMICIQDGVARITMFICRIIHLIRVPQILAYADLAEAHLQKKCGVTIQRALVLVTKAGVCFVIVNHWLACAFFAVHRYAERGQSVTYVIKDLHATWDPVTGIHNVCDTRVSYCYARSVYFVMSTMSGVGYGDVQPFKTREFLMQWVVAVFGAYCLAMMMGFCTTYFQDRDANGDAAYKNKIADVQTYINFRELQPALQDSLLAHYAYVWRKVKSVNSNRNEVVDGLSAACGMEVAVHLHSRILAKVPLLADTDGMVKRRLAHALNPQVALADSYIYKAGNIGYFVMFLSSGEVKVTLTDDRSNVDSFGLAALKVLLHKQSVHGQTYRPGDHFGEYCVLSKSGLCPDNALAVETSEVYTLSKEDLWTTFLYMSYRDRRSFLLALFTRVGGTTHLQHSLLPEDEIGAGDERIKNLYRMSNRLLTEIVDYMDDEIEEDATNSATLKLMHTESMSQLDMMYIFDDIRTPSGSFIETGSGKGNAGGSALGGVKFRINRQRSTKASSSGVGARRGSRAHRRSELADMPEEGDTEGPRRMVGRQRRDSLDSDDSFSDGTSTRRASDPPPVDPDAQDMLSFDDQGGYDEETGLGIADTSAEHPRKQGTRKPLSMGERRKALQLLQIRRNQIPAQRSGADGGADQPLVGSTDGSQVVSTKRRHSSGSIDLTNASALQRGGGGSIIRVPAPGTAGAGAGAGAYASSSKGQDFSTVVDGALDTTASSSMRTAQPALGMGQRPSEQLDLSAGLGIDFQAFKNAREIEDRILGRRPNSVEGRKRGESFHN